MLYVLELYTRLWLTNWNVGLASDKLVKLWNAYTGELKTTLSGHTEGISDVAWSPGSEYLASASDDKSIRIWEVETVSK